jgi:hypothetical protein
MDWGVGVLRGIRSHGALAHIAPRDIEAAIANISGAARLVDRLQRDAARRAIPRRRRRKR